MPQEINLNTTPYNDDFDADKGYYKVLFNPSRPVQARELTTLQSILQNQVEQFGRHVFKEGSLVIPGQLRYDNPIYSVEIESSFNGVPVSLYLNQLVGKKVRGSNSGVTAEIFSVITDIESERNNYTVYVKFLESGGADFDTKIFSDGETLILETPLTYANLTLQAGQGVVNTIGTNAVGKASSVSIAEGVYFVRGYFVKVFPQTILLDQYGVNPSYKVGFDVIETIVTADEDASLYDNAQEFSNYTAPGADRLKIDLILTKKPLDDLATDSFVEILRLENGSPQFFEKTPQYNIIRDELAKRTFDSDGNYFVKPFSLFVRDSLNDRVLNNGIYFSNQTTVNGNTPSEDQMVYQIGPGKAYVNGYDVETISARLIDVPKTRTTKTVSNQVVSYNAGTLFKINRVYGSPVIGLGTTAVVSLMDSRIGATDHVSVGTTIGLARVYDFIPESDFVDDTSRVNLRLFDIETYTNIGLNTSFSTTVSESTFIKGQRSNATGFVKTSVGAGTTTLTLYGVDGTFLENEPVIIDGIENGRLIKYVKDYSLDDVKSVYAVSGITTFNADLLLDTKSYIASPGTTFQITGRNVGISTVSAGLQNTFNTVIKPGDIISYTGTNYATDPVYNRVVSVSLGGTNFTIAGITTVPGVCDGVLPASTIEVNNVIRISPTVFSQNSSLLTELPAANIVSLNLENNVVTQRRLFANNTVTGSTVSITIDAADTDVFFSSFDEDRFVITYADGSIEPMREDKYSLSANGKILTFYGLTKATGTCNIIATVDNLKPNSKQKKFNKVSTLTISNSKLAASGIGTTTLNDGLTYSTVYGTRVQDEEICLNVPDVVRVLAVYESYDTSAPSLPYLQLNSFSGTTNSILDFVVGEQIVGSNSGAVAIIVARKDSNKLEYVYLNTFQFIENEAIVGSESATVANIELKSPSSKNVTQNYLFDNGQRDTFYDYSRIIRKKNITEPTKSLRIVFQSYEISSTDTGEFVTANSYTAADFKHNVDTYNSRRLTDQIDIRPRVAPYTGGTKSPFEFAARSFASDGQYSRYLLAPGENINVSYSYYLGRIDKVLLNSDGTFEVSQGIPSDDPIEPSIKENTLDIATILVPPYVYDVNSVEVDMAKHKRYRMEDIAILEDRIQRVEEFTTLSALEAKTENFTIKDAETGLDRFKCGFFVDNFSSHEYHDLQNPSYRAAIDTSTNTLRPPHYTTSIDLQLGSESIAGIAQTFSPNSDHSYVSDLGSLGVKKTGDLITLNYDEVLYFEQPYATKTESVTPFLVRYWTGSIELNPPLDSWISESTVTTTSFNQTQNTLDPLPDENITIVNNVGADDEVWTQDNVTQSGIPSFDWIQNARNILSGTTKIAGIKIGKNLVSRIKIRKNRPSEVIVKSSGIVDGTTIRLGVQAKKFLKGKNGQRNIALINQLFPPEVASQFITQIRAARKNRRLAIEFTPGAPIDGSTTTTTTTTNTSTVIIPPEVITTDTTTESISNYVEPIRYLRSRNIEFDVKGLRPVTKFYSFFEGIDVNQYIVPKLLEIEMVSGRFQIGETIESDPLFTTHKIRFRACSPNHKTGPHNAPNEVFRLIPFNQQPPPSDYSETSTYVNIDTRALQLNSETEFYGSIAPNMQLIGKSSGAIARIKTIRLVSDNSGRLIGSLFIPNPDVVGNPKWINGENTFTVIDVPTLDNVLPYEFVSNSRFNESSAEAEFASSGVSNVTEVNILTTRNVTIIPSRTVRTTTITNTTTTNPTSTPQNQVRIWEYRDPIAQSFFVQDENGIFITSIDVFFETVDDSIPVTLQIRPMSGGVPSNVVVPLSEVTLDPSQIQTSVDASVPTRFTFPSPVYLSGPQQVEVRQAPIGSQQTSEFAVVLLSNSPQYRVFIAELGFNDIQTGIKISQQPTLGSLFKSQNGSTWTPSQLEDLKYRINRAEFVEEGLVRFFNPNLGIKNRKVSVTGSNQIVALSKKVVVGLGSTGYLPQIVPGVDLYQDSASGTLVGIAGSIATGTSGVIISNPGSNYENGTYNNQSLITNTGYGKDATANITVSGNVVSTVSIVSGGTGYQNGDTLYIPSLGNGLGTGVEITVSSTTSNNTFVIDNVQGSFTVGMSTISYKNSSGIITTVGAAVTAASVTNDQYYTGRHLKIYQVNHGMHSTENFVSVSNVRPTREETNSKLSAPITSNSTSIPLVSTSGFETFENLTVSGTNLGYVIIGDEVISYTGIANNALTGVTGITRTYEANTSVYKYEFNGISLNRINKTHNFADVGASHPIDLNSYFIKLETAAVSYDGVTIGKNRPDLYFNSTKQTGESGAILSSNVQYEALTPNVATIVPSRTNLSTRVRTFTGTSIGGNEKSFMDDGYIDITLDDTTYFATPKLVCSKVNEEAFITESPGNRSLTMEFLMQTNDSKVSPVIDTISTSVILTSNLINNPVGIEANSNYANDERVRSLLNDPHSVVYISKPIALKLPANSIKVILSASRNETNDIRVLYQLFREDSPNASNNFELFPGYSNYQVDGQGIKRVIDTSLNDGSADTFVRQTSDRSFREYEYSVDDLPEFTGYAIKIVMAGSNQATPPIIKDLRAIATIKPKV